MIDLFPPENYSFLSQILQHGDYPSPIKVLHRKIKPAIQINSVDGMILIRSIKQNLKRENAIDVNMAILK
jgi:hypothetical protein